MIKNFLVSILILGKVFSQHVFSMEDDSEKKILCKTSFVEVKKKMPLFNHISYTVGAFSGSLAGSLFVHIFDTLAARKFSKSDAVVKSWDTTKAIFRSYLPVGVGVVPMRAVSFGIYSMSQELLLMQDLESNMVKIVSAALSGVSLTILSTPAEILKTKKQLEIEDRKSGWLKNIRVSEIKNSFIPLSMRVVPTVTCMLAGTEYLSSYMPFNNKLIATSVASIFAALISQTIGTPSENIRIYKIQTKDYQSSVLDIIRKLTLSKIYTGFFHRSLSLGVQAAFTLNAAYIISAWGKE